ncbi:MAG TPA: gephyrin-like molybdotransferase Glp [Gemmatimonadaceae bacterium]|nr:gephyrin-like molybdotransferase Glp [Gemmatimonadaceae bacterium]
MFSVTEASARIMERIHPLPLERVALVDALGRVLAKRVVSPLMIPAWDNSAMDGYAVLASDIAAASAESPVMLDVTETVAAGSFPSGPVERGRAVRIMTGAPMPDGADTVVRVEDTDDGVSRVLVHSGRDAGRNVRRRGEDIREGDVVLEAGSPLGPAQLGVLASVGAATVDVHRRPRVAFLASGDEIVDLDRFDEALEGKKIVSSNSYTLRAMIQTAGAEPVSLGIARDDPDDLRERLSRAGEFDLLITSAGISAGEYDYIRPVLDDLGVTLDVWRVRMRPGAPLGHGWISEVPWIGLPGNPVSTMVTFDLFVRPVIRRMLGHDKLFRVPVPVTLDEPVSISARLTHFLRAIVRVANDGRLHARLTGAQGSGILSSMARANALLIVPEERTRSEPNETLNAFLLGEEAQLSTRFSL